jgi:predicted RNA binding protein with dsRBD fold (UPF0201 family)
MRKNILFIGGSLNQTTMMHEISKHFLNDNIYFSPYYGHGYIDLLTKIGILDFTILGGKFFASTMKYFKDNNLDIDYHGEQRKYDLVFTCQDLIFPRNIEDTRVVLVQEGMTDPDSVLYYLVKYCGFPRYSASTAATGLSDLYDRFCVASEGYKDFFIGRGIKGEKIVSTGIPNFDNCKKYQNSDFPYMDFVLVATSDARETLKIENRKAFIKEAIKIAGNKQLIFKLHPNENFKRATAEIKSLAPNALIFTSGNISEMIAKADILVTKYSSCVYVGMALGVEVRSHFNLEDLKKKTPIQNDGDSARRIAEIGKELINIPIEELKSQKILRRIRKNQIKQQINDNGIAFGNIFRTLFSKLGNSVDSNR